MAEPDFQVDKPRLRPWRVMRGSLQESYDLYAQAARDECAFAVLPLDILGDLLVLAQLGTSNKT